MTTHALPKGYNALSPYLIVADIDGMIEFLTAAFDATLLSRAPGAQPGGEHAEMRIDDSVVMLGGSPSTEATSTMMHLYVDDVDAVYQAALSAGATSREVPAATDYGQRRCAFVDPSGNSWFVAKAE